MRTPNVRLHVHTHTLVCEIADRDRRSLVDVIALAVESYAKERGIEIPEPTQPTRRRYTPAARRA